ncbi:putative CONSERVED TRANSMEMBRANE PROTEIN [Leifsonia rubra CMS 76R]|nr:putative CONSERVED TRANSMEMBRANE PROTEIN [Leifsonia rubra CMS 76R]
MQLYADYAPRRARQVTGDIVALVFIVVWIALGVWVYQLIAAFQQLGIQMQEAGAGFRSTMVELGDTLGSVPLIGTGIRVPFDGASDAGAALETAGQSQQATVLAAATAVGVIISVVPIALILLLWLLPRIRFAQRATEAKNLLSTPGGTDLLALRALSSQKLSVLSKISPEVASQWRAGDRATAARLAQLQLRSLGVRSALVEH